MVLTIVGAAISVACSTDDDEFEQYVDLSINNNIRQTRFGDENSYYIPDNLIGETGCGYKAIYKVLNGSKSMDEIKDAMKKYDSNVENFPAYYLGSVIHDLTGKTVGHILVSSGAQLTTNVVSVNDIICVSPTSYGGATMTTGHATVVTSIENKPNFTLLHCYDGCSFDIVHPSITMVFRTSQMN